MMRNISLQLSLMTLYGLRTLCQIAQKNLCIQQIPRHTTPPLQPDQVEMTLEPEHMDIDIQEDLPDLTDVPVETDIRL